MAHSKYLRWLDEEKLTTKVAKRFATFCDEDIEQRANAENFDANIYEDAMKLVIDHFEGKITTEAEGDDR